MPLAPATRRALVSEQSARLQELQQTASSYAPDTVQHRTLRDMSRHFTDMCSSLPDPSSETRQAIREEITQKTAIAKSENATEMPGELQVQMETYLDEQLSCVNAADSTFGRDALPDDVQIMSQALRREVGKLEQLSSAVGAVKFPKVVQRLQTETVPQFLEVVSYCSQQMTQDSWNQQSKTAQVLLQRDCLKQLTSAIDHIRKRTSVDIICGDGRDMDPALHSVLVKTLDQAESLESIVRDLRAAKQSSGRSK